MAIPEARQVLGVRARPVPEAPSARWASLGLAACVLVCVASVAMATAGASSDAAFGRGLLQLLIVGGPIAVGLFALRAPVNRSFGIALLVVGFAWSLTALTESTLSVPHTLGRLATWLIFPCVVYLLLAFPHGRVAKGLDRAVFAGVVVVMLVGFYGTAPFVQAFPPKTLWTTCTTDCPKNALFVLDDQPALLTQVILVREWLIELLWLGIFSSMFRRWRAASHLQRRALEPPCIAATLLGLSHYAHITLRQLGAPADTVIALSSAWTFCIVAVCAAFVYGLVRRRMRLAWTLSHLGVALRAGGDRAPVGDALTAALGGAEMELLLRDAGSRDWHDARGRAVDWPPELSPVRAVTVIDADDGCPTAALVHDVALLDDQELLDGVGAVVLASRRHERLTTDLGKALSDLKDSRRRIAEAADLERERIERDLHDGAQQRLIALRIRLGLAEELMTADAGGGVQELRELGFEVERAIDELRALAHGVYPPLLTDRGVSDALRSVVALAPPGVHIVTRAVTRHPIEIESAVYFTCVEALQNALKHAAGATGVWIELDQTPSRLRFEVRDDGPGFAVGDHNGRGLRNMRDRIEAVGGDLTVDSGPGAGTSIIGTVPLPGGRAG
jgi:signal transduction histidine kinase